MEYRHIPVNGDSGHLSMPGHFDVMSSAALRMPFARLLSNDQTRKVVLDFSQVDYIDSMGIGTLIAWQQSCQASGKALVFEKCNDKVVNLLRRTGVGRLFVFS
jgi:anti-anti-sigma factor